MYDQLIQPNTNIAWINGVCLVDVREAFGVAAKYPTAIANWDANTAVNHPNQMPPGNVAVPIFFSCSNPDGHVCLWDNGTIYTSSAQGKQIFTSIQALINWMGQDFKYLGWSEEIESTPVVKAITPAPTPVPSQTVIQIVTDSPVWTGAGKASPQLSGHVEAGQKYGPAQIMTNGWALITFTKKNGYVPPAVYKII